MLQGELGIQPMAHSFLGAIPITLHIRKLSVDLVNAKPHVSATEFIKGTKGGLIIK